MAKSHIFLAKGILKKYENKNKMICFIKDDYQKIFTAYPKSYNTQMGYYLDKNEKILNIYSEDKFIKLINFITKKINNNLQIYLTNENRITILKYLSYQILRNQYLYERLNTENNTDIDSIYMKNILINMEQDTNIVWNAIKNCSVQLMINATNSKFLLPITSTISLNSNSKNEYVFILFATPNIAFNIYSNDLYKKPIMAPVYIDEKRADGINLKILQVLKNEQINDVIGIEGDLKKAIKFFNKNKL